MPKKYEAIRDSLLAQGRNERDAKRIAAATYNKERKPGQAPVTGHHKAKPKQPRFGLSAVIRR